MSAGDAIHSAHPYPCKFPPDTARRYLRSAEVVLDPFCGSGTTLLEAARAGAAAVGYDCNPIAVLISRFKLLPTDANFLSQCEKRFAELQRRKADLTIAPNELHDFPGRDHWFGPVAKQELATLLRWLRRSGDPREVVWLETALSAIINRVSFQDSETRYARVEREVRPGMPIELFVRKARELLDALKERGPIPPGNRVEVVDVVAGIPLADASVSLVVTSPPYANTMDYYLYHKQRMNVLGYDFKEAQTREIGSRWEFSSLKARLEKWIGDYKAALYEIHRVLEAGGRAMIVIGDSQIAGETVDAAALTLAIARPIGFRASVLESVPLAQRSRSFNAAFQRPNKSEHVISLRKSASPVRPARVSGNDRVERRVVGIGGR